jgi:hypothetical protein
LTVTRTDHQLEARHGPTGAGSVLPVESGDKRGFDFKAVVQTLQGWRGWLVAVSICVDASGDHPPVAVATGELRETETEGGTVAFTVGSTLTLTLDPGYFDSAELRPAGPVLLYVDTFADLGIVPLALKEGSYATS